MNPREQIGRYIRTVAEEIGFDAVGICQPELAQPSTFYKEWLDAGYGADMHYLRNHLQLKSHIEELLPGAKSAIAVRVGYNQPIDPLARPRIARYALGRDYHKVLRKMLKKLVERVQGLAPKASFRICVDSAPVLERTIAQQAGLGWFGKNTCLIDSKFGSWFFIGVILTDLDLTPDLPANGGCGTCRKCIDSCPTGAIVQLQDRWVVDSRNCISYLTIEKRGEFSGDEASKLGEWIFGCDICQEVCPFNQPNPRQPLRATTTLIEDFKRVSEPIPPVGAAQMQESDWDVWSTGRPVRRMGYDGFVRNLSATRDIQKGKD